MGEGGGRGFTLNRAIPLALPIYRLLFRPAFDRVLLLLRSVAPGLNTLDSIIFTIVKTKIYRNSSKCRVESSYKVVSNCFSVIGFYILFAKRQFRMDLLAFSIMRKRVESKVEGNCSIECYILFTVYSEKCTSNINICENTFTLINSYT